MNKTEPTTANLSVRELLASNVRRFRLEKAMSLDELAAATGIDAMRLKAIEAGRDNVRLDALERLASALGVPLRSLFVA